MVPINAVIRAIRTELRALADPGRAVQGQSYSKQPLKLYGVRIPEARRISRERYAELKKSWSVHGATDFCDRMLADPYLEMKVIGPMFLGRYKKHYPETLLTPIRRWIERGDCSSWPVLDCLGMSVLIPLVDTYPELTKRTHRWTASKNMWLRRAAAVALTRPARHGVLLDEAYDVARSLLGDKEDLIHKATGWLLRDVGVTDRKRLRTFLLEWGPAVPRTTLRYAIEHFPKAERKRLLAATRATS